MAIKGPKGAIPTPKGWVHARTGELLKAGKINRADIDAWHGIEEVAQHEEHVIQTLHEAPHVEVEVERPSYNFYSTFQGASEQED